MTQNRTVSTEITTHIGQKVTLKGWLYHTLLASWLPAKLASLAWALLFVTVWLGLMGLLYRRRIFVRI